MDDEVEGKDTRKGWRWRRTTRVRGYMQTRSRGEGEGGAHRRRRQRSNTRSGRREEHCTRSWSSTAVRAHVKGQRRRRVMGIDRWMMRRRSWRMGRKRRRKRMKLSRGDTGEAEGR